MPPKKGVQVTVNVNLEEFIENLNALLDNINVSNSIDNLWNLISSKKSKGSLKNFIEYIRTNGSKLVENPLSEDQLKTIINIYEAILNKFSDNKFIDYEKLNKAKEAKVKNIVNFVEEHITFIKNLVNENIISISNNSETIATLNKLLKKISRIEKNISKDFNEKDVTSVTNDKLNGRDVRIMKRDLEKSNEEKKKLEQEKKKLAQENKSLKEAKLKEDLRRDGCVIEKDQVNLIQPQKIKPEPTEDSTLEPKPKKIKMEPEEEGLCSSRLPELNEETRWFSGDEMNRLLQHFFGRNENVRLVAAINLFQHEGEVLANNLDDVRLQDIEIRTFTGESLRRTIIVPVNLGNHWAALRIYFDTENMEAPIINYFDPFGDKMPEELQVVLHKVYREISADNIVWDPIKFQSDGYNCGPWTIAILYSLVNRNMLPDENFNINDARKYYLGILAEYARSAPFLPQFKKTLNSSSSSSSEVRRAAAEARRAAILDLASELEAKRVAAEARRAEVAEARRVAILNLASELEAKRVAADARRAEAARVTSSITEDVLNQSQDSVETEINNSTGSNSFRMN